MPSTTDLTGRRALILGANSNVAASLALALAEAGADVAVTSTTGDPEEAFSLRGLRRKVEALGRRAIADIADLGNGSSTQIAVRQVAKQFEGLDLVVVAPREPFSKPSDRISDAEWSRATGLNFDAYFYACRAAFKELTGNDGVPRGRIVALLPYVNAEAGAAIVAARAGAQALIQALAREWAGEGVLVAAVALGAESEDAPEDAVAAVLQLAAAEMDQAGVVLEG